MKMNGMLIESTTSMHLVKWCYDILFIILCVNGATAVNESVYRMFGSINCFASHIQIFCVKQCNTAAVKLFKNNSEFHI